MRERTECFQGSFPKCEAQVWTKHKMFAWKCNKWVVKPGYWLAKVNRDDREGWGTFESNGR